MDPKEILKKEFGGGFIGGAAHIRMWTRQLNTNGILLIWLVILTGEMVYRLVKGC